MTSYVWVKYRIIKRIGKERFIKREIQDFGRFNQRLDQEFHYK